MSSRDQGDRRQESHKFQISNFKFQIFPSLFLIISLFFVPHVHAATVDATVDRIQKQFSTINNIEGKFSQTSYIKDLEQTQKYSGMFYIKKPSSMMWEYKKPRDEKVVMNESDTWIHKRSENQVIKTKFTKDAYSQVPLAMLWSMEKIRDDFDISMPEENALQLEPKRKIGFLKTLVLEVSPEDFPVRMFTIIDTYGNIIMIDLEDVRINPGLDDALFNFTPPAGAEVFDLSK